MVPGARMIINTLFSIGDKALEIPGLRRITSFTDDNDKWYFIERYKGLTSKRVMLNMIELTRHVVLTTFHQAYDNPGILTGRLDFCERMESFGHTIVDEKRFSLVTFDNIAIS